MAYNHVELIGNLGGEPEMKITDDGMKITSFSVATTEKFKKKDGNSGEQTEWHRIVAFNRWAEIATEYLKKGSKVFVVGKLQTREYKDKDGQRKWSTSVAVRFMDPFLGSAAQSGSHKTAGPPVESYADPSGARMPDDDIPF